MDFTIAGSVLAALLVAIPAITAYFQRANRATRRENRRLRVLVQEFDLHTFRLERQLSARGIRPPTRPTALRALIVDDESDQPGAADADPPALREPGPGQGDEGGPRHRSP